MRIGMILDNEFPPDPRVENEAYSLISAGHEVILFCVQYKLSKPAEDTYNGIKVRRYKYSRIVYKLSALAYPLPFYHFILKKNLCSFIILNEIDVIHIHDIQVARAVFNVNKEFNKKIILDLHENRPEIMKHYTHVKNFFGQLLIFPNIWKYFEKKYINKAFKTIVVTRQAVDYYRNRYKSTAEKFIIVPNTIREEFVTNSFIDESIVAKYAQNFTLLYLGDTGIRRGTLLLLEALSLLKTNIPEIKLIVVGKSKSDSVLNDYITKNNLSDFVDMCGWQSFNLFPSYITASKIGLSPLLKNIHHDTTFPNKIFQYLAFGKPVIVSDCEAQAELINSEKCGLVFKNGDAKDMASQIMRLYSNQNVYNLMSDNARNSVSTKYNWNNTSLEMINMYSKL
jgi:glycosyltransferase involved in cell wall biosynthesis